MVLKVSLDNKRILLLSSPRRYSIAKIVVVPDRNQVIPSFSGKVVKTMLIKSDNRLEYVFTSRELQPKPIHITPLGYIGERGKVVYLWKKEESLSPLRVYGGEKYFFQIGFEESIEHLVLDAINGIDGLEVFGVKWYVMEIDYSSIEIPSEKPEITIDGREYVKVELRSPANLIDPYKKTRFKRFLPLAGILFAYNIGEIARIIQRNDVYWSLVNTFNAVLQETHNVWETVKKVMYVYEGKALPGLIGYIKYYIDKEFLDRQEGLKKLIENTLIHATIMGIGSGRANGFGHVTIKTE